MRNVAVRKNFRILDRATESIRASGQILVRGDSAYGNRKVVRRVGARRPTSRW